MRATVLLLLIIHSLYSYEEISPETLSQWISGNAPFEFLLIDVRETYELTSVIGSDSCGAYNFPLNSGIFDEAMGGFPYDTAIVIYCASGNRSRSACSKLQSEGFSEVYNLTGGMSRWDGPTLPGSLSRSGSDFPEVFCDQQTSIFTFKNNLTRPDAIKSKPQHFNLQGRNTIPASTGIIIGAGRTGPARRIIHLDKKTP